MKIKNRQFYKTFSFWLGMLLVVLNVYLMVHDGRFSLNLLADIIALIVGIVLVISSIFYKS